MKRHASLLLVSGLGLFGLGLLGGCAQSQPVSQMQDVPPPTDDFGKSMGPMPLAVGDRVGRSVFMNRTALVARGVVPTNQAFADGSMSPDEADRNGE